MSEQVSFVRYFADMRKLVSMCLKLSIDNEKLKGYIQDSNNKNKRRKHNSDSSNERDQCQEDSQSFSYEYPNEVSKKAKQTQLIPTKTRSEITQKNSNKYQLWACKQCDRKYKHYTSLKRHVKTDHQSHKEVQKQSE